MTDDNKLTKEVASSLDTLSSGVSAILSLFPLTAPIGAMGSFSLMAWQKEQQQQFLSEVKQKLETIDETKVDGDFLETDEFKELVVQTVEAASKTASDLKQQALARALVNSTVLPTSKFSGKSALIRVLAQMSDEEMLVLNTLKKHCQSPRAANQIPGITAIRLAEEIKQDEGLQWDVRDVLISCQGLRQLGCAVNDDADGEHWMLTELADKLIDLVLGDTTARS